MMMDCTRCDDLLLDLAYGELDEVTTAAAQRHVEGCTRCTAAMADVRVVREACRAIEMPEPPASLDARILAAAHAAVGTVTARPREITVDRPIPLFARFFDGFAALAMKPQMAMAAVLVVVVGVAVLVGDQARFSDEEAAPSMAMRAPAPPPAEIRPVPPPVDITPTLPGAAPEQAPAAPAPPPALRPIEEPNAQPNAGPAEVGRRQARDEAAPSDDRDVSRTDAEEPVQKMAPRREADGNALVQAPAAGAAGGESERRARSAAPSAPVGASAGFGGDVETESAEEQAASGAPMFDRGVANYNRNRYREAADDLGEFVARPGNATSLIPTARSTRSRAFTQLGRCNDALREVDFYTRSGGSSGTAAELRVDAGDCFRRNGQIARAEEVYAQAENQAGASEATRSRARRNRTAIDAAQASEPAQASPPAAVDSFH